MSTPRVVVYARFIFRAKPVREEVVVLDGEIRVGRIIEWWEPSHQFDLDLLPRPSEKEVVVNQEENHDCYDFRIDRIGTKIIENEILTLVVCTQIFDRKPAP